VKTSIKSLSLLIPVVAALLAASTALAQSTTSRAPATRSNSGNSSARASASSSYAGGSTHYLPVVRGEDAPAYRTWQSSQRSQSGLNSSLAGNPPAYRSASAVSQPAGNTTEYRSNVSAPGSSEETTTFRSTTSSSNWRIVTPPPRADIQVYRYPTPRAANNEEAPAPPVRSTPEYHYLPEPKPLQPGQVYYATPAK
jgi:hypothetical protein